jgi:hypothetical protein
MPLLTEYQTVSLNTRSAINSVQERWRSPFAASEDRNNSGPASIVELRVTWRSPFAASEDRNTAVPP